MEHEVYHVHQLEVLLVCLELDLLEQHLHLFGVPPAHALLPLGCELLWRSSRERRSLGLAGGEWLSDIKPLALPLLYVLYKGALEPAHLLVLANHHAPTLCEFGATGFQLDAEDLQPQFEVWLDTDESLANSDEGGEMEDGIQA